MCLWALDRGASGYLIVSILLGIIGFAPEVHRSSIGVSAAPQKNVIENVYQSDGNKVQAGSVKSYTSTEQKTADLTTLINETLKINNKPPVVEVVSRDGKPNFRDDWTFDRVEYDLMDFLQELNARYQYANKTDTGEAGKLERRQDLEMGVQYSESPSSTSTGRQTGTTSAPLSGIRSSTSGVLDRETVTKTTIEAVKKELDAVSPTYQSAPSSQRPSTTLPTLSPSQLPISIASSDHDIAESTWQYGIFDRFTRPRTSTTTTTQSPDLLVGSGSGAHLDVRTFNSDECGLRSYRVEADNYPDAGGVLASPDADTDEMTKELSQRRQRPSLGGFFSSHKKYYQTGGTHTSEISAPDSLGERPLDSLPPFDHYGEPTGSPSASPLNDGESNTAKYHKHHKGPAGGAANSADEPPSGGDERGSVVENEFNLALRRQWLQQQLGNTLQMLGLNTSGGYQPSIGDYLNKTGSLRENMMKMSAAAAAARHNNKLAKSYTPEELVSSPSGSVGPAAAVATAATAATAASGGIGGQMHGANLPIEANEQELKARQDELKLEARVIGGNDARLGDSPWSASLQALVSRPGTGGMEYRHYCGGTIISEYYILTAAHCLDFMVGRESRLFVVVGDLNWRMSAASLHGRRFGIEKLIIHGGYKSTAFGHDIGLVKTKESMKPLKVNGRYIINSVCLPERNVEHMGEAELVGWGLFSNRNEMADSLQIADVPILPRPLCVDLYRRRTGLIQWLIGIELITEKQVCAGTFGRGICQGDSGSALVYNEKMQMATSASAKPQRNGLMRDHQQRATIIGVVAFGGIRRCSYQSLPGVYMQTSKYLDWILPRIQ